MIKLKDILQENINEIGDAGMRIRPWKFDGAKSDYRSAKEFKDFVARYPEDDEFDGQSWYKFTTKQGTDYEVSIEYIWMDSPKYRGGFIYQANVDFYAEGKYDGYMDKSMSMTNKGEVFEVMATITDIVVDWINEWSKEFYIDMITIEPKLEEPERDMLHAPGFKADMSKRGRLYKAYIQKQIKKLDGKYLFADRKGRFEIYPASDKHDTYIG